MIPHRKDLILLSPDLEPELWYPLLTQAFSEDLGIAGDITTKNLFDHQDLTVASVVTRQNGILCGLALALAAFQHLAPELSWQCELQDGARIKKGQTILKIKGPTRSLLSAERIALNFLGLLSGIATKTAIYVQQISGTQAKILDTRKTLPLYRSLQKYAVRVGGGFNHRMGLFDAVMIKDNHIARWGSIKKAVLEVRRKLGHTTRIEVEIDRLQQLPEVLDAKADIVLLDNMGPETLRKAVTASEGLLITEASGGITLDTIRDIASSGVDYISVGGLTHSIQNLDFGLDIAP